MCPALSWHYNDELFHYGLVECGVGERKAEKAKFTGDVAGRDAQHCVKIIINVAMSVGCCVS